LHRLERIDLISEWVAGKIARLETYAAEHSSHYDLPLDGPQVPNIEVFRAYTTAYLQARPDIHTDGLPFLVRVLDPTPQGLPVELYIFTKTTDWVAYEAIQAEIFEHLLAAANVFDLRVFQQPSGLDLQGLQGSLRGTA